MGKSRSPCTPWCSLEAPLLLPPRPSPALGIPRRHRLVNKGLRQKGLVSKAISTDKYLGGWWRRARETPRHPLGGPVSSVGTLSVCACCPHQETGSAPPHFLRLVNANPLSLARKLPHTCHHQTAGPGCLLLRGGLDHIDNGRLLVAPLILHLSLSTPLVFLWGLAPHPQTHSLSTLLRGVGTYGPHLRLWATG